MTRLVIASHNFPPARGGIERLAHGLAAHVLPGSTTVLAGPGSSADEWGSFGDDKRTYEVVRRPLVSAAPPRWWAARRAVASVIGAAGPEAVLALEWWPEGRALARMRRRPATAVVVHGTEVARSLAGARARRSLTLALRSADHVVAVSAFTADLVAAVGVEPVVINPGVALEAPAVDVATVAGQLGVAGRPVVLTVARLVARKGHADLLTIWPRIVDAVPDAVWLVPGEGPESAALRAGAPPSVRFLGGVDDAALAALYRLADVHVLPGRQDPFEVEGFGMAALEAGAAGTPTVATDVGGTAEAVGSGGIVVRPGQASALADAVIGLLRDSATRDELGRRARSRAEDLAWPEVGRRYRRLLHLDRAGDRAPAGAADAIGAVAR